VHTDQDDHLARLSRRKLLASIGSAVLASSLPGVAAAQAVHPRRSVTREDRFGRLFPGLRPFAEPSRKLTAALLELGQPGGIMDAGDDLAAGPVQLIVNADLSRNNPNNPAHTAGTTFFGQFMDHDLTFDLTSKLGQPASPRDSLNTRTPAFDLDAVYGRGPRAQHELYVPTGGRSRGRPLKFKVGHGGRYEDLPRDGLT
jgi:hypothetical protein